MPHLASTKSEHSSPVAVFSPASQHISSCAHGSTAPQSVHVFALPVRQQPAGVLPVSLLESGCSPKANYAATDAMHQDFRRSWPESACSEAKMPPSLLQPARQASGDLQPQQAARQQQQSQFGSAIQLGSDAGTAVQFENACTSDGLPSMQPDNVLDMPAEVHELLASLVDSPPAAVPSLSQPKPSAVQHALTGNAPVHVDFQHCLHAPLNCVQISHQQAVSDPADSPVLVVDRKSGAAADCITAGLPENSSQLLEPGLGDQLRHRCSTSETCRSARLSHSCRPFSADSGYSIDPSSQSKLPARLVSDAARSSVAVHTCRGKSPLPVAAATMSSSGAQSTCSTVKPRSVSSISDPDITVRQQLWLAKQRHDDLAEPALSFQHADCSCSDSEGSISSENNLRPSSASRCQHGCLQVSCKPVSSCMCFTAHSPFFPCIGMSFVAIRCNIRTRLAQACAQIQLRVVDPGKQTMQAMCCLQRYTALVAEELS